MVGGTPSFGGLGAGGGELGGGGSSFDMGGGGLEGGGDHGGGGAKSSFVLSPHRSLATTTFLANDESITIIPSFNLPEPMELISGSVGPFRAGMNTSVPLWLATMFRRRKLAKIVPPPWMDADVLREVLLFERDPKEASFSPDLPFRHAEIARAILSACRAGSGTGSAAGDGAASGNVEIPNADTVKLLLEDIAAVRMDKIQKNVHSLSSSTLKTKTSTESIIDVTNIGSMEMHAIRPFVTESFRMQRELSGKGSSYSHSVEAESGAGGQQSDGTGRSGGSVAPSGSGGRGRLGQQSRLVREQADSATIQEEEEEELMDPRPLEEMEEEGEEAPDAENAGRSRLRRHR